MRRRARGLTLVEVVVTTGVAAMLLVGILNVVTASGRTRSFTREHDIAREAARAKLEEVLGAAFDTLEGTYDGQRFPVVGLTSSAADQEAGRVHIDTSTAPASPGPTGLKRVTVEVRWESAAGGSDSFSLTTFVAEREQA